MAMTLNSTGSNLFNAESLFDDIGPRYEQAFSTCKDQGASIQWLLENLSPRSTVLDIGCGTGRPVCSALADAGHNVHGIDISDVMLHAAKHNIPSAKFEKADFKVFTAPNNEMYDAITVFFSLIAGLSQQDIKDSFMKINSLLKPQGRFVFATVPVDGNNQEIKWLGRRVIVSSLTSEDCLQAIQTAGFTVAGTRSSKFMPQAVQAGICSPEDVWEEDHLFVHAIKSGSNGDLGRSRS